MKNLIKKMLYVLPVLLLASCSSDDDGGTIIPFVGESKTYDLKSVADPSISGTAKFIENENGSTTIELQLSGTPDGGMHPAHIHFNTAAEGGAIALTLGTVDGDNGFSTVTTGVLDLGDDDISNDVLITYEELIAYDGYINVHLSANDLGTLVAQGDIGQNELTGTEKVYTLGTVDVDGINGTATFSQRVNGETLSTIQLNGTPDGGMHPSHIHVNTAAEGGAIAVSLGTVDGTTGVSKVNISSLDFNDDDDSNDTVITYDELLGYDGYINVHFSADDLGTLVAQGDIGQNELTGTEKVYALGTVDVDGINGTATFSERVNGETLSTIQLDGTPDGGMHPSHIHVNTAAEGGAIAVSLGTVDGTTGVSKVNISNLDFNDDDESNDTVITYDELLGYDGYINVHLSADDLGTLVAQGDIGQNELTGVSTSYVLATVEVVGISGTVTFDERSNGEALATIQLIGTPDGGMHPAHIHMGSVATAPGGILYTFNPVNGTTGVSKTNVATLDDTTAFVYSDVLIIDGYVNVHLSADDLGTLVAQGNIGSN